MKRIVLGLSLLLLLLGAGCSKETKRDPKKDMVTTENFITELKAIEQPAAQAFDIFLLYLDSVMADGKVSLDSTASGYLKVMQANKTVLLNASTQFEAQALSAHSMPINDTLSQFLLFSAAYLGQSYEARAAAVSNFIQFYSLQDNRLLDGYMIALDKAKVHSNKAFFWITVARQYASGMEAPEFGPEASTSPQKEDTTLTPPPTGKDIKDNQ